MKYKVLVLTNRVKVEVKDDFEKATDYIKRHHDFEVDFDFKEIDIPVRTKMFLEKLGKYWFGTQGTKEQIRQYVEEGEYHAVIFAWDKMESPITLLDQNKFVLTSWSFFRPLYPETEFIELVTSPRDDRINHIYKSIIHELYHSFVRRARRNGANVLDVMDWMEVNGVRKAYYKNHLPEAPDGNFAKQRELLEGMDDKILYMKEEKKEPEYKYFSPKEIVGLKPELVTALDIARGKAGIPFVITSGFRSKAHNKEVGGVENSSHTTGLAVDISAKTDSNKFAILKALLDVGFNRIGLYKTHIHADMDSTKSQNVLWKK